MRTCDHVAFQVRDMDVSLNFYSEKLDFKLNFRALYEGEGEEYAFLTLGDLRLELIRNLHDSGFRQPAPQPPYCPHLALETDDMAQSVAQLQRNGVPILHGPQVIEGEETWLYFTDPDNNVLEYIQWFKRK